MRIHFIYLDTVAAPLPSVQLGVAIMSSFLKAEGHYTSLSHVRGHLSRQKLIQEIKDASPHLVAFSSNTLEFTNVILASKWIKEELQLPTLVGGWHSSINPEDVMECEDIDMLCIGEGEYAILELAEKLEANRNILNIRNLWIRKSGHITKNPLRPLINNLDELPSPDRELFDYDNILRQRRREASFTSSRGCPFNCTFCCNNALRRLYINKGKYVRLRSVGNVLDEIQEVANRWDLRSICFDDDLFTSSRDWIRLFCTEYPKRFDIPFSCNVRIETMNEEVISHLKSAGCNMVRVGIETGNEWLRRNVLKKKTSNENLKRAFGIIQESGIKTTAFNMIGLPYETPKMIEETLQLNKQLQVDFSTTNIFYPYQGTDLYNLCLKEGFLDNRGMTTVAIFQEPALNLPTVTNNELRSYYDMFRSLAEESGIRTSHPQLYPIYRVMKLILGYKTRSVIGTVTRIVRLFRSHLPKVYTSH